MLLLTVGIQHSQIGAQEILVLENPYRCSQLARVKIEVQSSIRSTNEIK